MTVAALPATLKPPITIAVGNVIPHMYAGWAGGAKMVQPGFTSAVTTGRTHLIAGPRVYQILGNIDNEVRKEMETIAVKSGLKFIVNVVLDASGTVAGGVAGGAAGTIHVGETAAPTAITIFVPVVASGGPGNASAGISPCSLTTTGGSSGRTTRANTDARSSTASMNRPFMRSTPLLSAESALAPWCGRA